MPPDKDWWDPWVCRGVAAFMLFALFMVGCRTGIVHERGRAVRAGAGRWEADPATGDTTFRYLSPEDPRAP